ncbi:MAG TPA: hypothetical protein VK493_13285 [Bryobacteraceae bacterium]|nr:hypothetical protein [Bryobacteraceae bacterium]
MRKGLAVSLVLAAAGWLLADPSDHSPQLLLTPQRSKRLKRDRVRQTARWQNFEARVQAVPDSPERGFELALYYAATQDEARGKEAIAWALAHLCDRRQVSLILDWCGALVAQQDRDKLKAASCPAKPDRDSKSFRDEAFSKLANGEDIAPLVEESKKSLIPRLAGGAFQNAAELYAACEFFSVALTATRTDLREEDRQFFSQLPAELLLALKAGELEHPDPTIHLAALALIGLDPNLASSQFLQGWAISDRQTIREGPGVAYEMLWADPYLPGVGYQNLDPWIHDTHGRLFARAGWEADSCHIRITTHGVEEENCPPHWRDAPSTFGKLTLIPATQQCFELPKLKPDQAAVVWRLKPGQTLNFGTGKKLRLTAEADAAGLWRPGSNIEGKVCAAH